MQTIVNPSKVNLVITFTPEEAWELASIMELAFESQRKQKGACLPDVNNDFFRNFALTENDVTIEFGFGCIEIGAAFLKDVTHEMASFNMDTTAIERTLEKTLQLCGDSTVRH